MAGQFPQGDELVKSGDSPAWLTYTKWGLMGLGGLLVLSWIVKLLLNPLTLVAIAVLGGLGYFGYRKLSDDGAGAKADAEAEAARETKATGRGRRDRAREVARLEAEREAEALLAAEPEVPAGPSPAELAAERAAREAASRDRRLAELAALKDRVARESDGRR